MSGTHPQSTEDKGSIGREARDHKWNFAHRHVRAAAPEVSAESRFGPGWLAMTDGG